MPQYLSKPSEVLNYKYINYLTLYLSYLTEMQGTPSIKYSQGMKNYWLCRSKDTLYYYCLEQLAHLIVTLFKNETTHNLHHEFLKSIKTKLSTESFELYNKLVHGITLLNSNYRIYTYQGYLVTKEDMINVLSLFQLQVNPKSILSPRSKAIYSKLEAIFLHEEFTILEASRALKISKRTLRNHIIALLNTSYITHTRTGSNRTFYYQLV